MHLNGKCCQPLVEYSWRMGLPRRVLRTLKSWRTLWISIFQPVVKGLHCPISYSLYAFWLKSLVLPSVVALQINWWMHASFVLKDPSAVHVLMFALIETHGDKEEADTKSRLSMLSLSLEDHTVWLLAEHTCLLTWSWMSRIAARKTPSLNEPSKSILASLRNILIQLSSTFMGYAVSSRSFGHIETVWHLSHDHCLNNSTPFTGTFCEEEGAQRLKDGSILVNWCYYSTKLVYWTILATIQVATTAFPPFFPSFFPLHFPVDAFSLAT